MSERRAIRRWLQLGILDLLILTTIVAVGGALARPSRARVCKAKPWIVGIWRGNNSILSLFPDGYFFYRQSIPSETKGLGWTLAPWSGADGAFALQCGELKFIIRTESGSRVMEVLNEDGSLNSRLEQAWQFEGPMRDGKPDGTWTVGPVSSPFPPFPEYYAIRYRDGQLVDLRWQGVRSQALLNQWRGDRGLPELTDGDFPNEDAAKDQRHE